MQRCLDISLDLARQINALWEPLQQLAPLFSINTKADFLVRINGLKKQNRRFFWIIKVGIKCLETAVYGACKRIEIFSSTLIQNNDNSEDTESLIQNNDNSEDTEPLIQNNDNTESLIKVCISIIILSRNNDLI